MQAMYCSHVLLPKDELIVSPPPEYPFQQAVTDLFQIDAYHYIVFADRYTGWIEVEHFSKDPPSYDVIKVFRGWFHRFGIPSELSLDGGSNLDSKETLSFLNKWGVKTRQSSAYYPKSNGTELAPLLRTVDTDNTKSISTGVVVHPFVLAVISNLYYTFALTYQ